METPADKLHPDEGSAFKTSLEEWKLVSGLEQSALIGLLKLP